MVIFEGLLAKLSERPNVRGREFERVCRWFLLTAPEYRSQLRRVWLWDEWPGQWAAAATDEGAGTGLRDGLAALQPA